MNIPAPSLNDLYDFVNKNTSFFTVDETRCITMYMQNTSEKYSNGKYWLKGQLEKCPDGKITPEDICNAIEIDKKRYLEYGGPCNGLEARSIEEHNYKFEHLQKVLQKYYELVEEEYLRPPDSTDKTDQGGIFYQQIAEKTLIGK